MKKNCPKCNKEYLIYNNYDTVICDICNIKISYIFFVNFCSLVYNEYMIDRNGYVYDGISSKHFFDFKRSIASEKEAFQLLEKYLKNIEFQ